MTETLPPFLTTKEVADLLRVKERKVYDLAAEGEIPHRRITGKLLFPRAELMAWVEGSSDDRPAVLAGSHDPLLDWAVRESDSGLALLTGGSLDGLARFADRGAALAGLHIPEAGGWNEQTVAARGIGDCVLITWATRARGLILSEAMAVKVAGLSDLKGCRVALRQSAAGTSHLWDQLLADAGMTAQDVISAGTARTESDAATMVAEGQADAALGLEAMARQFGCDFLPLISERFDLIIDRRAYFQEPIQRLLSFARGPEITQKAAAMGGYDLREFGTVRWTAP